MKPDLSFDKRTARLAENAAFLALALALSFVESLLPHALLPLPGFKPGLANIAVVATFFRHERTIDAVSVSLCRSIITFFLFGNVSALLFSLLGGAMTIVMLTLVRAAGRLCGYVSFIGVSVLCATAHNMGQLLAALLIVGEAAVAYLPSLLLASALYGAVNGFILNLIPESVIKYK